MVLPTADSVCGCGTFGILDTFQRKIKCLCPKRQGWWLVVVFFFFFLAVVVNEETRRKKLESQISFSVSLSLCLCLSVSLLAFFLSHLVIGSELGEGDKG